MKKEELKELFKKYANGTCTEKEKALLEAWYLEHNETGNIPGSRKIRMARHLIFLQLPGNHISLLKIGIRLAAAAVIIGFLITVVLSFWDQGKRGGMNDIPPGTNKALLTLPNGRHINLTDAINGALPGQPGVQITKTRSGQVTFSFSGNGTSDHHPNTISTPAGGQWQVQLADGTKVWLNAASTITFPSSFSTLENRMVTMQGEAYFEVAKDPAHPFIVITGHQRVEVLGTHFNINSYADESTIRTTLIEGRVKVSVLGVRTPAILHPGFEAATSAGHIVVSTADADAVLAWKNGYFQFNDEPISSVMRKLARWYNVDVRYEGPLPKDGINGKVSRNKNISQVIKALEATETVHFKVEGRRVIVMR